MQIGPWKLPNSVIVAPMAGVTDRPFRRLCKKLGAGHAISEMAASNPKLWESIKTSRRLNHEGETDPITVQIVGSDPELMVEAALFNIDKGAKIIDINMGCPAKKVCKVVSGSALLRDEPLIAKILDQVVKACAPHQVPVTLKTRTGWDQETKNVLNVAKMAEDLGIAALTIHGRTRCDFYTGKAEYDTIAEVKSLINIPIIANGDINNPLKAKQVLEYTKADAIMIGRAAQGNPWIFNEINYFLKHNSYLERPSLTEMRNVLLEHLQEHYQFYGEFTGVRTARKHIAWYLQHLPDSDVLKQKLNQTDSTSLQTTYLKEWFDQQIEQTNNPAFLMH